MNSWQEVQAWRVARRKELLNDRMAIRAAGRLRVRQTIEGRVRASFADLPDASIGFYWPFRGEIDLRPLIKILLSEGAEASLPVVVGDDRPLEFRDWQVGTKMSRSVWNIPVPAERKLAQPTVMLIPLLGFDAAGYRLGYGGGYYDRTLASLRLKPSTIGVGYEAGRLPTIYPQPHDFPLDAIVTEAGVTHFDSDRGTNNGYASPACYLHEGEDEKT